MAARRLGTSIRLHKALRNYATGQTIKAQQRATNIWSAQKTIKLVLSLMEAEEEEEELTNQGRQAGPPEVMSRNSGGAKRALSVTEERRY